MQTDKTKDAHLYRLKVAFSVGHGWNLTVLAVSANDALTFIDKQSETANLHIESVELKMLSIRHEKVKDSFSCRIVYKG